MRGMGEEWEVYGGLMGLAASCSRMLYTMRDIEAEDNKGEGRRGWVDKRDKKAMHQPQAEFRLGSGVDALHVANKRVACNRGKAVRDASLC